MKEQAPKPQFLPVISTKDSLIQSIQIFENNPQTVEANRDAVISEAKEYFNQLLDSSSSDIPKIFYNFLLRLSLINLIKADDQPLLTFFTPAESITWPSQTITFIMNESTQAQGEYLDTFQLFQDNFLQ